MDDGSERVDLEMSTLDGTSRQLDTQQAPPHRDLSDQCLVSHPPQCSTRSVSFGRGRSTTQQAVEDEIVLLGDIDIDVPIPLKLTCLDFPKAEEGREEDVAKVIRKSFSKLGLRSVTQDALSALADSGLTLSHVSWQAQIEKAVEHQDDQFWEKVATKSQSLGVGMMEAIFEVYTDLIVEETGSPDMALLWVLKQDYKAFCMELFVTRLLESRASVFTAGNDRNTPLHLAALKGYVGVGRKLLEAGALAMAQNRYEFTPLELAIQHSHNEFAVLLIRRMDPPRVRQLFQSSGLHQAKSKLSLHSLLEMPHMKETVLAVLDTLSECLDGQRDTYLIHYAILDCDHNGRAPSDPNFDKSTKSCLHKIAKSNNKDVVYHDVVRLLLRRKWKKFARYFFFLQFLYFLMLMAMLTASLVLAAKKVDPRQYNERVDVFRGICEAVTFLMITYNGIAELNQLRIHKLHYFRDYYNYLDMPAVIFTFLIIPLRATGLNVQWVFASLTYLFNGLRAFKYAAVFRSTGAYVQILFQVLLRDMIQFGAIFSVFLFSFSGSFYLALRGEVSSESAAVNNMTDNSTNVASVREANFTTNLDLYPFETAEIYSVWFTGIRVMIEGATIVDQYFGPQGFMWLGVIIYLVFLFLTIVVLLNLLIAQMSDTYSSVQQDAQRSLAINRAWIVARVEHNSMVARDMRKWFYKSCEVIEKLQDVLEKWEIPPINEVNKKLEKLEKALRKQDEAIEDFRTSVMEKLVEQSRMIEKISSSLHASSLKDQSSRL